MTENDVYYREVDMAIKKFRLHTVVHIRLHLLYLVK